MTEVEASPEVSTRDLRGWATAAGLAVVLFALSWTRHRNGWTGHDLAIFDQATWQLAHGRDHVSIIERRVLADHFSPVLYAIAPLYRLAATPAWLFAIQAVAMGVTVLPMRAVARHFRQPADRASLLVGLSSVLLAAALFDFHPGTLAVPFVATAILGALTDRPALAVAAAIGVGLCRADLAPVVLGVAVVAVPRVRWWLLGVVGALLLTSTTLPSRFGHTNDIWFTWFGHLGDSPIDAAVHPWRAVRHVLAAQHLSILVLWIVAAGVALVRKPRWLLAVLVAGAPVLLSRWEGTGLPWYHYGAPIAPLAIAGTLHALSDAAERTDRWSRRFTAAWWCGPVAAVALAGPLSPLAPESNRVWTVATGQGGRDVEGAVALVGEDDSVSADQRVLAHLAHREHAYLFPIPFDSAPEFFPIGAEPDLDAYADDAVDVVVAPAGFEHLAPADRFEVVGRVDGYVVLRRLEP